jgi:hypothetical protein
MSAPIKAGDECIVITGLGRHKSPNIGKKVLVGHRQYGSEGADSRFGPIVRCTGPEVYQMDDSGNYFNAGWADFAVAWLMKADPQAPKTATTKQELQET